MTPRYQVSKEQDSTARRGAAACLQARYMERDVTELRAAAGGGGAAWAGAAAGDAMQDMFVQVSNTAA